MISPLTDMGLKNSSIEVEGNKVPKQLPTAGYKYKLGEQRLENSLVERDLGVLVGSRLSMSQECALSAKRANCILWFIKHSKTSQAQEVIILRYSDRCFTYL